MARNQVSSDEEGKGEGRRRNSLSQAHKLLVDGRRTVLLFDPRTQEEREEGRRRRGGKEEAHSRRRVDPSRGLVRYVTARGERERERGGYRVGRRVLGSNFSLPRASSFLATNKLSVVRRNTRKSPFRPGTRHPKVPPFCRISYVRET